MSKHWSGRFGKNTAVAVEEFTASIFFDVQLVKEDLLGSLAHVEMLGHVGILTPVEVDKIQEGLKAVAKSFAEGKITLAPQDEDIHMKVESELKALIGSLAGKLHTARSRNDQVALDMHLYMRSQVLVTINLIAGLVSSLLSLAEKHSHVIMPGYTHLQRAQPILFAHHLMAYVAMFFRDVERLQDSWPRINRSPLGACALAGTGLPIDRQRVAAHLKFEGLYDNSIDAVSDRDFCVEFLADASLLMTHLSRLSEEIILWCSQEFAFIELDDAYCTGSSIMPQKKNPDIPELVRGKAGRVYGSLLATLTMLKGLPLAYNKDMQEDKEALFDAIKTVQNSLSVFAGLIDTLQVREDNMLAATKEGLMNATEVADYLAAKGMPFREAHAVAGKIVRYCLEQGCGLEDLVLEQWQNFSPLFEADLLPLLDHKRIVNTRDSLGGTSSAQVARQFTLAETRLKEISSWLAEKQKIEHELVGRL